MDPATISAIADVVGVIASFFKKKKKRPPTPQEIQASLYRQWHPVITNYVASNAFAPGLTTANQVAMNALLADRQKMLDQLGRTSLQQASAAGFNPLGNMAARIGGAAAQGLGDKSLEMIANLLAKNQQDKDAQMTTLSGLVTGSAPSYEAPAEDPGRDWGSLVNTVLNAYNTLTTKNTEDKAGGGNGNQRSGDRLPGDPGPVLASLPGAVMGATLGDGTYARYMRPQV